MIQLVFAVFDGATKAYMQPFFCNTIEEAMRSFRTICNDPSTTLNQYPGDYTLFQLGEYDQKTGVITSLPTPHSLGLALTYIREKDGSNAA